MNLRQSLSPRGDSDGSNYRWTGTTHVPSIGKAIAEHKEQDSYWKPFVSVVPPALYDELVHDPEALMRFSIPELVELAGSQGVEFLNWVAMHGALTGKVTEGHRNYHIPISNTAAATMLLDNHPHSNLLASNRSKENAKEHVAAAVDVG
jgi:hypothetical protein